MYAKPVFPLTLLALALAVPSAAFALGLGRLSLQSSLGQPLSAQIELTSASQDELSSLSARVADPSLYRQNNLGYQGVLSRARITVERNANGEPYLRVVTSAPVTEPYLDLMVELNSASGRVVREYTFLLDPPGVTPPVAAVEPVTPVRGAGTTTRPATAGAPAAGSPYTVRRGDTLGRIAAETKPATVSLDQMLVALYQSNPDAFDGNNMNRLRSGSVLNIPSADEVTAAAPVREANRVVRVQAADWRAYRDRLAAAATPESTSAGARTAGGRIGTATTEAAPAAPVTRDQVRISRDAGQGTAAAAEDAAARDRALKDAQARITELERTLKDLQRAVEMKSQTVAQLTPPTDASKAKAQPAPTPAPPPPVVVAPAGKAEPPVTPSPRVEPPKAEVSPPPPAKALEPPKAEVPPAPPTVATPTTPAPVVPAPVPVTPPPASDATKAPAPITPTGDTQAEPGFFEDVLTTTPPWAIGIGALAVLAGLAALLAARRKRTTKFEDSIISGTDIKTNTVFGSTGGGVVNTGENSLSSDFSREGLGNIDTDEVDPIAEAEVYLAYGRDAQAEEILKDALKKDPQRQEIYLKLLEIHAQHNKPSAFETVASELYSVSHGQGEVWQRAVVLGRQLDPNNPMFVEGGNVAAVVAAGAAAGTRAAMAETPAASPLSDVPPVPVGVAEFAAQADAGMDLKFEDEISIAPTSGGRAKTPADILAGAQSELDKTAAIVHGPGADAHVMPVERDTIIPPAAEPARAPARPVDTGFDLDFHLDDAEKPAPIRAPSPSGPASYAEPAFEAAGTPAAALARPQAAIELDKLDLSFDPDRTTFEDPTPSVLDGQWHDAATKLDLAKAYQEMGDIEGAREILQEVLHEGDEQQRSEAQALLAKLG